MKLFGITSLEINGTVLHICNVRVLNTLENSSICSAYGAQLNPRVIEGTVGKGYKKRVTSFIEFKLITENYEKFTDYHQQLGKLLIAIAQNNLNSKYAWVSPPILH
jgi:hypothetical protein